MPGNPPPAPLPGPPKPPRRRQLVQDDPLIGKQIGTFHIRKKLPTQGAMGSIYIADKNPFLEALKDPSKIPKDMRDLMITSGRQNPNDTQDLTRRLEDLAEEFVKYSPNQRQAAYESLSTELGLEITESERVIKVMRPENVPTAQESQTLQNPNRPRKGPIEPVNASISSAPNLFGSDLKDKTLRRKTELISRFEREMSLAQRLKHSRIVKGVESGITTDGTRYIAMEYVRDAIKLSKSPLTLQDILSVGRQVNSALGYAHSMNVIHRDVKPDNILAQYQPNGTLLAKLTDFGVAYYADQEGSGDMTKTQALLGTPYYLAPERPRSQKETPKSDVYSLGATLYDLITKNKPVKGSDLIQIISFLANTDKEPKWVREHKPEVSEDIEDLVMMMLDKNEKTRLSTAGVEYLIDDIFKRDAFEPASQQPVGKLEKQRARLERQSKKGATRQLADLCEKIGMNTPRDIPGAQKRLEAFTQARDLYLQITGKTAALQAEVLESRISLEQRRLKKLGVTEAKKEPKKRMGLLKTLIVGGVLTAGGLLGYDYAQKEMTRQEVVELYESAQSAFEQGNLDEAEQVLGRAQSLAADFPASSEHARNLDALADDISEERVYRRAESAYEQAHQALDSSSESRFEEAREHMRNATQLSEKLSAEYTQFKSDVATFTTTIENEFHYDQAKNVYDAVEDLMNSQQYSRASDAIDQVEEHLESITDPDADLQARVGGLQEQVRNDAESLAEYKTHITIYNSLKEDLADVTADLSAVESRFEQGEYFQRTTITALQERAKRISSMLHDRITVRPEAIGSELEETQTRADTLADERLQELLEAYDASQAEHVSSSLDEISQSLANAQDYTQSTIDARLGELNEQITHVQERFTQVGQTAENYAELSQTLSDITGEYATLRENRQEFTALASQDTPEARIERARDYLLFDHFSQAQNELTEVPEGQASLEREIITYGQRLQSEEDFTYQTPSGLTQQMVEAYAQTITWCRERDDYSNIMDMLSLLEGKGVDTSGAQEAVDRIKDIRIGEDEQGLEEQFSVLLNVQSAAEQYLAENGSPTPPGSLVRQLASLYDQLGGENSPFAEKAEKLRSRYE